MVNSRAAEPPTGPSVAASGCVLTLRQVNATRRDEASPVEDGNAVDLDGLQTIIAAFVYDWSMVLSSPWVRPLMSLPFSPNSFKRPSTNGAWLR